MAEKSAKRLRETGSSTSHCVPVASIKATATNVDIGGVVVTALSPMKKAKRTLFFDGEIADGTGRLRFYGFSPEVRTKLDFYHTSEETVSLCYCSVKRSKNNDLEAIVNDKTRINIHAKPLKFVVPVKKVQLAQLAMVSPEYSRVTVDAAVVNVDETEQIGSPVLKKQDIPIADSTGNIRLTWWEEETGRVRVTCSQEW